MKIPFAVVLVTTLCICNAGLTRAEICEPLIPVNITAVGAPAQPIVFSDALPHEPDWPAKELGSTDPDIGHAKAIGFSVLLLAFFASLSGIRDVVGPAKR